DRVLETELPADQVPIARRVLLALVDSDRSRAVRTDAELAVLAGDDITPVLEALRLRGIVMPLRARNGEPAWELVHDSLVPRVLAWTDRQDLARQRALEIVRHHLRGSQEERPSLLTAAELRDVRPFGAAIEELARDWAARGAAGWRPVKLVARSRRARRERWIAVLATVAVALSVVGFLGVRWFSEREERRHQELLGKADVGTFILELRPYDWDPKLEQPIAVEARSLPQLDWNLYDASTNADDPHVAPLQIDRAELASTDPHVRKWRVDARGGLARLVIRSRSATASCAPSIVPLARIPGYAARDKEQPTFVVQVPTCQASAADMVVVEAGPFVRGGHGEPPVPTTPDNKDDFSIERTLDLPAFKIDRTEVTNAGYRMLSSLTSSTIVQMPVYPATKGLENAGDARKPVSGIAWDDARVFCRYHGKRLIDADEWEKAVRGGLFVHGVANPSPRRALPWGSSDASLANLNVANQSTALEVDANPGDVSPYGVLDLAGNVEEWTRSPGDTSGLMKTRGGGWGTCTRELLPSWMVIENSRPRHFSSFELGFRCVDDPDVRAVD
ncbi:MAG TPA: formylglycine-generating enzyme family protein, partial [Kofleriaceae bacterium]|nr:formylglycine-generating enzyme family protein [Kofleriaceae bacterium]